MSKFAFLLPNFPYTFTLLGFYNSKGLKKNIFEGVFIAHCQKDDIGPTFSKMLIILANYEYEKDFNKNYKTIILIY